MGASALNSWRGDGGQAPVPSPGCDATTFDTLLLGLTDADGDSLSYSVDVVSPSLRKGDGTIVQALPTRQRVDFAGLADLTELVTAATTVVA